MKLGEILRLITDCDENILIDAIANILGEKGIALKEGSIGDTILVRSDKYNKTYAGIVKSENEVMVRI